MAGFQYFYIKSKLSGYVLDISGNVAFPGCEVGLWIKGNQKVNQMWRFDDETKTIRAHQADDYYVLDINESGGLIVNGHDPGRADQKWELSGDKLLNVDDPRFCLDVNESDEEKGARVIKYAFYGTENQFWECEPVVPYVAVCPPPPPPPPPRPRQEFYIVSKLHGKVATLNVSSGKLEIQPKAATRDRNQLFFADSNGYLHSAVNDLALTSKKGDQFSLTPDSADPSTKWKFDGAKVVDEAGNVADIQGGSRDDGVAVVSWEDQNQDNQRWRQENV